MIRGEERGRGIARGASRGLEILAAVITVGAVAIALINHFGSSSPAELPGEGKRIVAFRQVANRICTEHRGNIHRALAAAHSRVERLGYISRAIGWDVNDLESVTPPQARTEDFLAEISVRRRAGPEILALQRTIELHRPAKEAEAIADLEALEVQSRELSRSAGISRCIRILPPTSRLIAP